MGREVQIQACLKTALHVAGMVSFTFQPIYLRMKNSTVLSP
jgi:hypothetical protein